MSVRLFATGLKLWALGSLLGLLSPLWLAALFLYLIWRQWRTRVDVRAALSLSTM